MSTTLFFDSFTGTAGATLDAHAPDFAPAGALWASAAPNDYLFSDPSGIVPNPLGITGGFNGAQIGYASPVVGKIYLTYGMDMPVNLSDATYNSTLVFGFGTFGSAPLLIMNLAQFSATQLQLAANWFNGASEDTLISSYPIDAGGFGFDIEITIATGEIVINVNRTQVFSGSGYVMPTDAQMLLQLFAIQAAYQVAFPDFETYNYLEIDYDLPTPPPINNRPVTQHKTTLKNNALLCFGIKCK